MSEIHKLPGPEKKPSGTIRAAFSFLDYSKRDNFRTALTERYPDLPVYFDEKENDGLIFVDVPSKQARDLFQLYHMCDIGKNGGQS